MLASQQTAEAERRTYTCLLCCLLEVRNCIGSGSSIESTHNSCEGGMTGRLKGTALRCVLFLVLTVLASPFIHGATSATATVASGIGSITGGAITNAATHTRSSSSRKNRGRQPDAFRQWFTAKPGAEVDDDISLGAPRTRPENGEYVSPAGIKVTRKVLSIDDVAGEIKKMVVSLDDTKGVILTSSYEFPGRYARWTVGFLSPPLSIEGKVAT